MGNIARYGKGFHGRGDCYVPHVVNEVGFAIADGGMHPLARFMRHIEDLITCTWRLAAEQFLSSSLLLLVQCFFESPTLYSIPAPWVNEPRQLLP